MSRVFNHEIITIKPKPGDAKIRNLAVTIALAAIAADADKQPQSGAIDADEAAPYRKRLSC